MPRDVGRMTLYRVDKIADDTYQRTEIPMIECSTEKIEEFLGQYLGEADLDEIERIFPEESSFKCLDLEDKDAYIKNTDLQRIGASTLNLVVEPCIDYESEEYCQGMSQFY